MTELGSGGKPVRFSELEYDPACHITEKTSALVSSLFHSIVLDDTDLSIGGVRPSRRVRFQSDERYCMTTCS